MRWSGDEHFRPGHQGPRPGSTPTFLGEQSGWPGSDTVRDGEACRVSGDVANTESPDDCWRDLGFYAEGWRAMAGPEQRSDGI